MSQHTFRDRVRRFNQKMARWKSRVDNELDACERHIQQEEARLSDLSAALDIRETTLDVRDAATLPKPARKRKARRHRQEEPNKPLSFLFYNQRRDALRALHPGKSVIELATIIGVEWTAMSDGQKQSYYDLHSCSQIKDVCIAPNSATLDQQAIDNWQGLRA